MSKIYILLFLLLCTFVEAKYQKVKIGYIDSHFKHKINPQQLKNIIEEIKYQFDTQLGYSVFEYSDNGKPIDIIYKTPSQKKLQLQNAIVKLQTQEKQLKDFEKELKRDKQYVSSEQKIVKRYFDSLNDEIIQFNKYVNSINRKRNLSQKEYRKIKENINKEQRKLEYNQKLANQKKNSFNQLLNRYNGNIKNYNRNIKRYNLNQRRIENLSKSIKEKKGVAKGYKEKIIKSFYKDGKRYRQVEIKNHMQKIEIYGFESIAELKAILAHEIAHLVGIEHINKKNALMNPVLQQNQIKKLNITIDDIKLFDKIYKH
jgi:predicted Zn-dependent protease